LGVQLADEALIKVVLPECPSSVKVVKDYLIASGYVNDVGDILVKEEPLVQQTAKALALQDAPDFDLDGPIPFATMHAANSDFLAWLLMAVDSTSFAWAALKGMRGRGQKKPPPKLLCEILEFTTGLAPDAAWQQLGTCGRLRDSIAEMGRTVGRSSCLGLPPRWEQDGVYGWRVVGGKLYLTEQAGAAPGAVARTLQLDQRVLGEKVADFADYTIQWNFSAARGKLLRSGSLMTWSCQELMLKHKGSGPIVAELLAIEDGVAVATPQSKRSRPCPGLARSSRLCRRPRSPCPCWGVSAWSLTWRRRRLGTRSLWQRLL
jgi:hypothetical protein